MKRFSVLIEIHVDAEDAQDAEQEVLGLMSYAFEVSNDQGIFKLYRIPETSFSDTVEVEGDEARDEPAPRDPDPIMVCSACGSHDVFSDAWVGINDPSEVRTYDDSHCDGCEGPCSVITEAEFQQQQQQKG